MLATPQQESFMYLRFLVLVLSVFSLPFAADAADAPMVVLGGEVGVADKASLVRFRSAPFDSLPWIRADLSGEKASEFDEAGWGHLLFRPFKNYSGDISGRFIEIMAMNARGDYNVHPAFKELLAEVPKHQRPGGYFAASGRIDWQMPIDHKDIYKSIMMPALWGNARLLCGLVEASRAFPDDGPVQATARRLGDFYVGLVPRFTNPERIREYTGGGTYAAGYVTCYFPAMEGLVKLHTLTGERKYLEAAATMAAFYKSFDKLPIDHAHGMLCNQVSLVLLYEATNDASYLERVEKRWDELEIYLLKPTTVSSDTAASFDNLGSLTTDHPNVTVNGTKAWDGVYHAVAGIGSASQDSEFVYFSSVQPGNYSIEVSYSGDTLSTMNHRRSMRRESLNQDKTTGGDWGGVYGKTGMCSAATRGTE